MPLCAHDCVEEQEEHVVSVTCTSSVRVCKRQQDGGPDGSKDGALGVFPGASRGAVASLIKPLRTNRTHLEVLYPLFAPLFRCGYQWVWSVALSKDEEPKRRGLAHV